MTNPQHGTPGSSDASTDYQKTIRVQREPDALFDALTSLAGLTAWWTDANGSAEADGDITFLFPEPLLMHVDHADRATSVAWTVIDYDILPEWPGTHPTFTITPVDGDASELNFRHRGLTADLDCIEQCRRGWDHFLDSFRQYVETGQGAPIGSAEDQARRRERS